MSDPRIIVKPIINQMEVSCFMYRPKIVNYFQSHAGILVASSKSLHRGTNWDTCDVLQTIVKNKNKEQNNNDSTGIVSTLTITPAQILLRWCYQKNMIVISKTSSKRRMKDENRNIFHFALSDAEMKLLDSITTIEAIEERNKLEIVRKNS